MQNGRYHSTGRALDGGPCHSSDPIVSVIKSTDEGDGRFCPGNQLADTVMKALSAAMPGNVSAGIGNLKVIAFSGLKDETHWVHMEIFEGSYGGRLGKDGMDAVDTLYANTRNNPIEDQGAQLLGDFGLPIAVRSLP